MVVASDIAVGIVQFHSHTILVFNSHSNFAFSSLAARYSRRSAIILGHAQLVVNVKYFNEFSDPTSIAMWRDI